MSGFTGMREVVAPPDQPEPPQPPPETPQEALERLIAEVVAEPRRPRGRPHGAAERHDAPARLTAALATLRWTMAALGDQVGRPRQVVASWCDGRGICPVAVLEWVERLAAYHRSHPAPQNGRTTAEGAGTSRGASSG